MWDALRVRMVDGGSGGRSFRVRRFRRGTTGTNGASSGWSFNLDINMSSSGDESSSCMRRATSAGTVRMASAGASTGKSLSDKCVMWLNVVYGILFGKGTALKLLLSKMPLTSWDCWLLDWGFSIWLMAMFFWPWFKLRVVSWNPTTWDIWFLLRLKWFVRRVGNWWLMDFDLVHSNRNCLFVFIYPGVRLHLCRRRLYSTPSLNHFPQWSR